jgi:4'-phosphopantetheinyl transferase
LNHTIDVWRVDLSNSKLDAQRTILSDDEIQRAEKFVFDKDRNTFVRSRCALRLILARCLSEQANNIKFCYGEHGRPDLDPPASASVSFNLSHSGDMALVAVTRGRTVGIDLNRLGQTREWQAVAKRSFSVAEQALLLRLPEALRERAFYRIWSQKEAYSKALGAGFSYGFQNFTVAVDGSDATGLLSDDKQAQIDNWNITPVDAGDDWIAALAYEGSSVIKPRLWDFHYEDE